MIRSKFGAVLNFVMINHIKGRKLLRNFSLRKSFIFLSAGERSSLLIKADNGAKISFFVL